MDHPGNTDAVHVHVVFHSYLEVDSENTDCHATIPLARHFMLVHIPAHRRVNRCVNKASGTGNKTAISLSAVARRGDSVELVGDRSRYNCRRALKSYFCPYR